MALNSIEQSLAGTRNVLSPNFSVLGNTSDVMRRFTGGQGSLGVPNTSAANAASPYSTRTQTNPNGNSYSTGQLISDVYRSYYGAKERGFDPVEAMMMTVVTAALG